MAGSGRKPSSLTPAATLPVARVAVDVSLPHLDRPFDYLVAEQHDAAAVPGARVRVRFAGRLVDGYVLERTQRSEHEGRLAFLARATSAEPVLSPEVATLARAVADRQAGVLADVLRLAIPPRHGATERQPSPDPLAPPAPPDPSALARYVDGPAALQALAGGESPRLVWPALPGGGWPDEIAALAQATLASGRGAVVVVPDARDADRLDAAFAARLGAGRHIVLTADAGPAERYRRFLAVRRGSVQVVVGTRAAGFAPVHDLGLVVIWDDGDDLHAEPRAPYPHAREVLLQRAHLTGAGAVVGGFAVTAEGARLLTTGWARPLEPDRNALRAGAPRVTPLGDDAALARDPAARSTRLPTVAWDAARAALGLGRPVLVQVPRRGYQPALSCAECRSPARCAHCAGPLGRSGRPDVTVPACRWCGRPAADWHCPECGSARLRAAVVGERRTAEELGRAFPGVPVATSAGDRVLATVAAEPSLVVATPGAEPVADGGYGAALLLDGWALLTRPDLRAGEEALRRWFNAAALVRAGADGGTVVVAAESGLPAVQALIRWAPAWHAGRELAARAELRFPPAARLAALTGAPAAVSDLLAATDLPAAAEVLGPVPAPGGHERLLVRVPPRDGAVLSAALKAAAAARSARKAADPVRVQIDPIELL